MFEREITFDRVVRWLIVALVAVGLILLINRLSSVLLPFFIAWILAYMIYPFVVFLQEKCRLRYRVLSIVVALLVVLAVIVAGIFLVVPPIVEESIRMSNLTTVYFHDVLSSSDFLVKVQQALQNYANDESLMQFMQHSSVVDAAESILLQAWDFLSGTINFAIGLLGGLVVLLLAVQVVGQVVVGRHGGGVLHQAFAVVDIGLVVLAFAERAVAFSEVGFLAPGAQAHECEQQHCQ